MGAFGRRRLSARRTANSPTDSLCDDALFALFALHSWLHTIQLTRSRSFLLLLALPCSALLWPLPVRKRGGSRLLRGGTIALGTMLGMLVGTVRTTQMVTKRVDTLNNDSYIKKLANSVSATHTI